MNIYHHLCYSHNRVSNFYTIIIILSIDSIDFRVLVLISVNKHKMQSVEAVKTLQLLFMNYLLELRNFMLTRYFIMSEYLLVKISQ